MKFVNGVPVRKWRHVEGNVVGAEKGYFDGQGDKTIVARRLDPAVRFQVLIVVEFSTISETKVLVLSTVTFTVHCSSVTN